MEVRVFKSVEELVASLQGRQQQVDKETGDYGKHFPTGAKFAQFLYADLIVYGEVLDVVEHAGGVKEEVRFIEKMYLQPHMKNLRFCRCFSAVVPDGELGNVHVSGMHVKLTDQDFEQARSSEWPSDRRLFLDALGIKLTTQKPVEA